MMTFRGKFQVLGLVAIVALFVSADVLMAQPGGRGRPGGGGGFFQVNQLSLLAQESVQKELELVDDQIAVIKEVQEEQREAMREVFMGAREEMQNMRDMSPEDRQKAFDGIQAKMKDLNTELESKALEELLPHQAKRLKQLLAQAQISRSGGAQSGRIPDLVIEELGLTDEQVEQLKVKAEEVAAKLKEKIAKLQAQAQDEIFSSVLSKEQQAKYKEMIGDSFQFEERGRGGFGGGPGGPGGGPGGPGGGGNRGGRFSGPGGDRGSDF